MASFSALRTMFSISAALIGPALIFVGPLGTGAGFGR